MSDVQSDSHPTASVRIADFQPPDARSRYEVWKRAVEGIVSIDDDWRIDIGRAVGGDFIRVHAPRHAATVIWAHTEAQLRICLADAGIADTARALVEEFLDHNELGLAFDTLAGASAANRGDTTTAACHALSNAAMLIGQEAPACQRAQG